MKNIANRPMSASKLTSINTLLICMGLFCMPAHSALHPAVKSGIGFDEGVLPFIKEHPLLLDNLKEIKYFHSDKYHVIYTYTTADDEKKTCTAKFGPTFIFRPYIKFYGSDCPVNEWEDDDGFF